MAPQVLILDGGLGTSLEQKYNIHFDRSTPLWSSDLLISDPATLEKCQGDFGRVPVDIILTATYQVSEHGFKDTKKEGHPDGIPRVEIPRYLDTAVRIVQNAKGNTAKVALSVGPYGACMIPSQEYSGKYDDDHSTLQALKEWHGDRMKLFATIPDLKSRVGYVALETIPRADEIVAMRKAVASAPELSNLPFWISCLSPGDALTLPDGTDLARAVELMLDPKISQAVPWGIGINCTKAHKLDKMLRIYETTVLSMIQDGRLRDWPALVLYPDGTNGEIYNTETQEWEMPQGLEDSNRKSWEETVSEAVNLTAARGNWPIIVVGGCCRASSEDIARLRSQLLS